MDNPGTQLGSQPSICPRCGGTRFWGDGGCRQCAARDRAVADSFISAQGGRYVVYQYCISVVFMTFKRPSKIKFIRTGQSQVTAGLPYTLLSLVAGWWGIPWGPVYTIQAISKNMSGGLDVTAAILNARNARAAGGPAMAPIASGPTGPTGPAAAPIGPTPPPYNSL